MTGYLGEITIMSGWVAQQMIIQLMVKKAIITSSLHRPKYSLRRTRRQFSLRNSKKHTPKRKTLLEKEEEYSSSNIPRNINTKLRKPMDEKPEYLKYYRRADSRLYNSAYPGHKINEPLFILKLHSRLSILPNFLHLFCRLTEEAASFIDERIAFITKSWRKIKNGLYDKKFRAYKKLIVELRDTERPKKETILKIIKCGIYGERKCKFNKKVENAVDRCFQCYQDIYRQGLKA